MSTLKDVFDRLWPDAPEDSRDSLMWITPYPFVSYEKIVECLERMRVEYGDNIQDAIDGEMVKFDKIWENTREQRAKDASRNL